jgi:3-methyladenine DNA glycosylase AlkD
VLGQKKVSEAVIPLIDQLNDQNAYVRASVAWALAEIGSQKAVVPMVKALKRSLKEIRFGTREWKCVLSIAGSIERLTGQHLGTDAEAWEKWTKSKE